ncbi:MAG: YfhO family protein [Nocardioides sp.]
MTIDPAGEAEEPSLAEEAPAPPARRTWRRAALEGALAFVAYSVLTWVFFPAVRSRGHAFYQELLVNALSPDRQGAGWYLRHGQLPAWARDTYAGAPYAAQIQHALYYPGNLPFTLLAHPATALDLVLALSVAWAALGGWAYCRFALRTSYLASVLGGLAFGFGGMALQHVTLTNQLQALSWMPWVLLFAHLALETGRWRHVVLTAGAIGLGLLSGHPEEWVYTQGALVTYAAFWVLGGPRTGLRGVLLRLRFASLRIAAAFALFVGLFGFQLLPTVALMGQGYRTGSDFRDQYPMPKAIAVNSLLPDYGRVLYGENVAFIGVLALGLAALGLVATRRSPLWLRLWMGVLAALGFAMSVGLADPVYRFAYDYVPLVKSFRVPSRYLLLPSFTLSAAAALGADALLHDHRGALAARLRQALLASLALAAIFGVAFLVGDLQTAGTAPSSFKWLAAAAAGVLAFALMTWRRVPVTPVALALLLVVGLELNHARPSAEYRQLVPNVLYDDPGPVMKDLAAAGGRYVTIASGVTTAQDKALLGTKGLTGRDLNYFYAGWPQRIAARPNAQHAVRAETVLGRDGGLLPLQTYRDFFLAAAAKGDINGGVFGVPPSQWNWNGLDLLAIQSFVTPGLSPGEAKVMESHGFSVERREAFVLVWRRTTPPLGRVLYDVDVLKTREARVAALPTYPLLQRAMVNAPVPGLGTPTTPAEVRDVSLTSERVELDVTSSARGLLVVSDPWYPGWHVKVNGKEQEVLHADHAFRGVVVPAGHSRVVFTFRDRQREAGLVLLPLTLVGLAGAYVVRRRRRVVA